MGVRRKENVDRVVDLGHARPGEHFRIDAAYGIVVAQEKEGTRVQLRQGPDSWRVTMWSPMIRVEIVTEIAPADPDIVPEGF